MKAWKQNRQNLSPRLLKNKLTVYIKSAYI